MVTRVRKLKSVQEKQKLLRDEVTFLVYSWPILSYYVVMYDRDQSLG